MISNRFRAGSPRLSMGIDLMDPTFGRHFPSFFAAVSCLLLSLTLAACRKQPEAPLPNTVLTPKNTRQSIPWFEEVAAQSGISFKHSSGHSTHFYMPEMETGGVGLLDYDGDGLLDIFFVNGGSLDPAATNKSGCKLFHNLGNWKFEDVTVRAGVGGHGEYGMGSACGDFDGDGRADIYVTHLNGGILYHNDGDGTFSDVTREAGIDGQSWGTSAAFFDYDADGHLDLIVVNYLRWSRETELNCSSRGGRPDYCSPVNYKAAAMDTLYHNLGNGRFENATLTAGLGKAYGNGLGVVCADFDHDGRMDFFVANDAMPNQLWMNKGNGKFSDEALFRGCAVNSMGTTRAGMGVAAVDILGRGWTDLFITHLVGEGNGWFANTNGYFMDFVSARGPASGSLPHTGFGVGFADFDQDGNLDLYVANGRVKYGAADLDPSDPYAEPNTLMRGEDNGEFSAVEPSGGTARLLLGTSRGAAFGDLDNDGSVDIVVGNKDGPAFVLRNIAPKRGNWIVFRVLNRKGLDAINASLRIETGSGRQYRQLIPNQGYCSSSDPRVHFGLGSVGRVDLLNIRWQNGDEESFGPFEAEKLHTIHESTGKHSPKVFGY